MEKNKKNTRSRRERAQTLGQFLLKSIVRERHRDPISRSLSISRARARADRAAELRRWETEYWRSRRSAVFLASKRKRSKPSLALRQASLQASPEAMRFAKPLKSLRRRKARTTTAELRRLLRSLAVAGRPTAWGFHRRVVAMREGMKLLEFES